MPDGPEPPAWAVEPVTVVDPDPGWPRRFHELAEEVRRLLGELLTIDVAHIGSTAVPGLPAKPVIDLMATTEDPDRTAATRSLATASWLLVPPELDHRPWRRLLVRTDPAGRHRLAHLHLMRAGEPRWHDQLAFRDRLRADPALAAEYARVKIDAADRFRDDREAYTAAKAAFVRRVIAAGH